jgi:hypothetical protein
LAADEASLLVPDGPDALAGCLVALGRRLAGTRRLGWLSVAGPGFRSGLGRRVDRLLRLPGRRVAPRGRGRLWAYKAAVASAMVAVAISCTAWARPRADLTEGETTMNVLKSTMGRSLAAAAVAAVLAPITFDALAGEERDRPPKPDEARRGDADRPREAERPRDGDRRDRDVPEARRDRAQAWWAEAERRDRRSPEADAIRRQIEVMELALKALVEAERRDAAELMERAIRARQLMLTGRRDDEAREILERAPNPEQLADVLAAAAGIWKEFRDAEKAEAVGRLAREFAAHDRPREGGPFDRPREPPPQARHREAMHDREMTERRMDHLRAAVENLRAAGLHEQAERLMHEGERRVRGGGEGPFGQQPAHEERPVVHQEQLEGVVRELHGQVEQLRRELDEMRRHLERMRDRLEKEEDDD